METLFPRSGSPEITNPGPPPEIPSLSSPSPTTPTITVDSLQSLEQLRLLDEIDKLRAYGVNEFISLPQLVVCGDQSSGKSSVLEAITEIPFPRKDNLCTRFATQIVLRRGSKTKVFVKILADSKRPEDERKKLGEFTGSLKLDDFGNLPTLIESAQEAMGITSGGGAFSRDVLSIEITGPKRPQLTVVDLPGLTHSENKSQSREDVELVSEMVYKYMRDPRTIILAIITAKNDYANQIILKRAKEVDPEGIRTLGIITKPDMLPIGSESEDDFLTLAKNQDIFFKLGWHVLRNRSYEERNSTFADRNRLEQTFFGGGVWIELPRNTVGISALRSRLSLLLLNRIKQELPRVYQDISDGLKSCESQIQRLGRRRSTIDEQRIFLSKMSEAFGRLCKAAIDGIYEEEFFQDTKSLEGQLKRLRAVIQNFNSSFAEKVRTKGHLKQILDEDEEKSTTKPNDPEQITRKEAIAWVKPILLRSRGRELPGTYNPLLIGELFWEQSKPWEYLAQDHLDKVWRTCRKFLQIVLQDITPANEVLNALFSYWIDEQMQERFDRAVKELKSLLTDRRRHAITYNHYCTENMQTSRKERLRQNYVSSIKSVANWDPNSGGNITLDPLKLLDALAAPNMVDMDDYSCDEVLDGMNAYYKTASKVFIDNIAVQVVERQVLGELWDIFSPSSVAAMPTELISNIAAESKDDQSLRDQLEAKQKSLKKGIEICRDALKGVRTDISSAQALHNNTKDQSFISSDDLASLLADNFLDDNSNREDKSVRKSSATATATSGSLFGAKTGATRAAPESIFTTKPTTPTPPLGGWFLAPAATPKLPAVGANTAGTTPKSLFGASPATGATSESLFSAKPATSEFPFGSLFTTKPTTPESLFTTKPTSGSGFGANSIAGKSKITAPALGTLKPTYIVTAFKSLSDEDRFQSITFMPAYYKFSFEELRLRDYEIGNMGPANPYKILFCNNT